jgi:hypothetical protein
MCRYIIQKYQCGCASPYARKEIATCPKRGKRRGQCPLSWKNTFFTELDYNCRLGCQGPVHQSVNADGQTAGQEEDTDRDKVKQEQA